MYIIFFYRQSFLDKFFDFPAHSAKINVFALTYIRAELIAASIYNAHSTTSTPSSLYLSTVPFYGFLNLDKSPTCLQRFLTFALLIRILVTNQACDSAAKAAVVQVLFVSHLVTFHLFRDKVSVRLWTELERLTGK